MLAYINGYLGRTAAKRAFKHWNNVNKQGTKYAAWSYSRELGEHDVAVYNIILQGEQDNDMR